MDQKSLFKDFAGLTGPEKAPKEKKGRIFGWSPFALQDAIGEKNVKKIWIEFEKLRLSGIEADELVHKMISKARDMAAIAAGASREDLEIKSEYPYMKSKRDLKNWKPDELKKFYTRLVEIYHKSRMSAQDSSAGWGEDLDTAIEKAILSI